MLIQDLASRVHLYVDADRLSAQPLPVLQAALRAGVGVVQFSTLASTPRRAIELAAPLIRHARSASVPFIISNRVEVALALGADGVHLGAEDLAPAYARRLLGPAAIVGVDVASPDDARVAQRDGATYVSTGRGDEAPDWDMALLRKIKQAATLPVCVSATTTPESLEQLSRAGVEMVFCAVHELPDDAVEHEMREVVQRVRAHLRLPHVAP